MENVYNFVWKEFSELFEILCDGKSSEEYLRKSNFDNVSERDKEIIRELAHRIAYALCFSEVDDGKEVL